MQRIMTHEKPQVQYPASCRHAQGTLPHSGSNCEQQNLLSSGWYLDFAEIQNWGVVRIFLMDVEFFDIWEGLCQVFKLPLVKRLFHLCNVH